MAEWNYYRSLPSLKPVQSDALYECIAVDDTEEGNSVHRLACLTTPANPAHLSIIIRNVFQRDGKVWIGLAANTATSNCAAFLTILNQFKQLNDRVMERVRNGALQKDSP